MIEPLTAHTLAQAAHTLAERDADLARSLATLGPPPLWARQPSFATLLHIILEQQVSLQSAQAAYDRLLALATPLTPASFLQLDDTTLRTIGFSRQKTAYGRNLARAVSEGVLDLDALSAMDDAWVREALTRIKGIGNWTAEVYLLMALGRADIWPRGDRALVVGIQQLKGLSRVPTSEELDAISEAWQPWRSVAARMVWQFYLDQRRQRPR